jgi:hypothetical protein
VKKVVSPPRTSVPIVDPRWEILKKPSRPPAFLVAVAGADVFAGAAFAAGVFAAGFLVVAIPESWQSSQRRGERRAVGRDQELASYSQTTTAWALPSTFWPSNSTVTSTRAVLASASSAPIAHVTAATASPGLGTAIGRLKRV